VNRDHVNIFVPVPRNIDPSDIMWMATEICPELFMNIFFMQINILFCDFLRLMMFFYNNRLIRQNNNQRVFSGYICQ
jgi:hypothetical protein